MADSERENAAVGQPDGAPQVVKIAPGAAPEIASAPPAVCPDCGLSQLTLIRDAAIVSVYKCPRCGHLAAPVKQLSAGVSSS